MTCDVDVNINFFFAVFASFPARASAMAGLASFAVRKLLHIEILLLVSIINSSVLFSQNQILKENIMEIAGELAENDQNTDLVNMYIDQLGELSENPVKINSADEAEISRLFFLSDFQVKALTDHVLTTGNILSVYEIASIPGFDRHSAEMILPFITLIRDIKFRSGSSRFRSNLLSNLIFRPGEKDTSSPGQAYKSLSKYKFTAGQMAGGFSIEKDGGEKFFPGSSLFPDFCSGYISFSGQGLIKKIIAGDFSVRTGQGLNLNTGIRTGLSLSSPGYMASRNEIRPYTSTDENNFFRGIAAQFSIKEAGVLLFFSHNRVDASTEYSPDSSAVFVKSFYRSGLHDSESALLKKDAVAETAYGVNLNYNFRNLKAGICWSQTRFSMPVSPDRSDPYKLFDFGGNRTGTLSIYYTAMTGRFLLYGESAFNDIRRYGFIQGATLRPSDRLSVNLLYRSYSPAYFSMHGNAAGTGSLNRNEQGILGNFTFEAATSLFITAGCDLSHYQWLTYSCDFPSVSKRIEIKARYAPREELSMDLSYYIRYNMKNGDNPQGTAGISESETRWIRAQLKYGLSEGLFLMTRIDFKFVNPADSRGMILIQDLIVKSRKLPVNLWLRYSIFSSDDWDSRLYAYENDLLYSFSIPAFSGQGSRGYAMINWEIGKFAELRAKYAITSLKDGNEYKEKDELKLQLRLWF